MSVLTLICSLHSVALKDIISTFTWLSQLTSDISVPSVTVSNVFPHMLFLRVNIYHYTPSITVTPFLSTITPISSTITPFPSTITPFLFTIAHFQSIITPTSAVVSWPFAISYPHLHIGYSIFSIKRFSSAHSSHHIFLFPDNFSQSIQFQTNLCKVIVHIVCFVYVETVDCRQRLHETEGMNLYKT